jgi:hypothetical protein
MTVPVAPDRSVEQRMEALERANGVRVYRAKLKRDIAAGTVDILDVLVYPSRPELATMKALELLKAVPRIGPYKAETIMSNVGASTRKTVGGLTGRQFIAIRAQLLRLRRVTP